MRCSVRSGNDVLVWDVARPARPATMPGVTMAGLRDPGLTPLDIRMIPHPSVTLAFVFGPGPLSVDDGTSRGHRDSLVTGPGFGSRLVRVRGSNIGCVQVRMSPVAATAVLGAPLAESDGALVPLTDLWGHDAVRVRERLETASTWTARFAIVAGALRPRSPALRPDPEVVWAWRRIVRSRGSARINHIATELGWSRTRLWTRFTTQLGLSPKRAATLVRFDYAAHRLAAGVPGARVAIDAGYADQSHLHRDVAAFSGTTPAQLARSPFLAVDTDAWAARG